MGLFGTNMPMLVTGGADGMWPDIGGKQIKDTLSPHIDLESGMV